MKSSLLCGMGMAVDMAGSAAFVCAPKPPPTEMIGYDFKQVGDYLRSAMAKEAPLVENELAQQRAKQLNLPLSSPLECGKV